jgi:hypothetical protein
VCPTRDRRGLCAEIKVGRDGAQQFGILMLLGFLGRGTATIGDGAQLLQYIAHGAALPVPIQAGRGAGSGNSSAHRFAASSPARATGGRFGDHGQHAAQHAPQLRRRPKTTESRQVSGVFASVREIPARA